MNNLTRWLSGMDVYNITSYGNLKATIVKHAKRDYLFFPFLMGYVESFLNQNEEESLSLKQMTLVTIYDLLKENKIAVYFMSAKEMELVKWETREKLDLVLERIKTEWDNCGNKDPEMNQVIWIVA